MKPNPNFEEPWHAQLFALTVSMNEAGHFDWSDWASRFGATLTANGASKELNGGSDYFAAWLETFESYVGELGFADAATLQNAKTAWEHAFLTTPHGDPVNLPD